MKYLIPVPAEGDLFLNSAAAGGLAIYRIEATWLPSDWAGTADTMAFVIERFAGEATGGTPLDIQSFRDATTSPSTALTGTFTAPADPQRFQSYNPQSINAIDGSGNNVSWGGFFPIDLTDNPIEVAAGHGLLLHSNYAGAYFNVYFDE
jgi:hypothetical protein